MGKFLLRFFILLLVAISIVVIYLSYFGIETDKFDGFIKNKANEVNKYVKLEFKKTKIHLNPTELNLVVILKNPKMDDCGDHDLGTTVCLGWDANCRRRGCGGPSRCRCGHRHRGWP